MARINAWVIVSPRATETVAFYRAVGVPLADEQHGEGPVHWACELDGAHIAVYAADAATAESATVPSWRQPASSLLGFEVDDLGATATQLRQLGAVMLQEPQEVPWGRRAVFSDPDGRPVELNENKKPQ